MASKAHSRSLINCRFALEAQKLSNPPENQLLVIKAQPRFNAKKIMKIAVLCALQESSGTVAFNPR